jgi:hypothetical protein
MAVVMVTNMEGWLWSYYLRRSRKMACGFVGDIGSIIIFIKIGGNLNGFDNF